MARTQLRKTESSSGIARPVHALCTPFAAHPKRRLDPDPCAHPPGRGLVLASHPRAQLFWAPWRWRGRGGLPRAGEASCFGAGAPGPPEPGCSPSQRSARHLLDPAPGGDRKVTSAGAVPLSFLAPGTTPCSELRPPRLPCWEGRGTSEWAGTGEAPSTPLQRPQGLRALGGKFPTRRGRSRKSGRSQL